MSIVITIANAPETKNSQNVMSVRNAYRLSIWCVAKYPADHAITIFADKFTIDEIVIYTLTGQQSMMVRPAGETIDISKLQTGMYILEVTVEGRKVRQKLVVE